MARWKQERGNEKEGEREVVRVAMEEEGSWQAKNCNEQQERGRGQEEASPRLNKTDAVNLKDTRYFKEGSGSSLTSLNGKIVTNLREGTNKRFGFDLMRSLRGK